MLISKIGEKSMISDTYNEKELSSFHDKMRSDLAYSYFRDIGAPDDLKQIANYMKTDLDTVERWRVVFKWDKMLHHAESGYLPMKVEQGLREEMLKDLSVFSRGVQQYLMTMFKRDEVTDEYMYDEFGELILNPHLFIKGASELKHVMGVFNEVTRNKLLLLGGLTTKKERTLLDIILQQREDENWDVFRTIRECELKIGVIPEFLRIEAISKKLNESDTQGSVDITIEMPGDKEVDTIKHTPISLELPE
jgi:hypothetical protein